MKAPTELTIIIEKGGNLLYVHRNRVFNQECSVCGQNIPLHILCYFVGDHRRIELCTSCATTVSTEELALMIKLEESTKGGVMVDKF